MFIHAACFAIALVCQDAKAKEKADSKDDFTHKQTGVVFPKKLGAGYERSDARAFGNPKLGIVVAYELKGIQRVSVYLYDLGERGIGSGIESEKIRPQYEQAKDDIRTAERLGHYRDVKLIQENEEMIKTPSGELRFLHAVYALKELDKDKKESPEQRSHLYVTGYKDFFLKIRITCDASRPEIKDPARRNFLEELGKLLK